MVGRNLQALDGQKVNLSEHIETSNKYIIYTILYISYLFIVFQIVNLLPFGGWEVLTAIMTVDNTVSHTLYYESLLIMKRRQYLVYKFLRDVIKEPIADDSKLKDIGRLIKSLQEKLYKIQDMLPYADYFQGGRISSYPEDIQAKAFMVLGQIKDEPWHVLAMEHGVYVKGLAVRVADW